MSYKPNGKGDKVDLVCDHKGCGNKVTAEKKGAAWQSAREKGWLGKSAAEHYCPTHKAEHGARVAKAEKPAKGKAAKATAKGNKPKKGVTNTRGTVWSPGKPVVE
jgi:hypothetical protein